MIPWMREKFAERRNRWQLSRKRDSPSSSPSKRQNCADDDGTNFGNTNQTTATIEYRSESDDETVGTINLRVISPRGGIKMVDVPCNSTGLQLKSCALNKFAEDSYSLPHFSSDLDGLLPRYKLLRSKTKLVFKEGDLLKDSGVLENEEFILVVKRTDFMPAEDNLKGPTASEVLAATKHIPLTRTRHSSVNINNLMLQADLQHDLRKILISLAKSSAFVIGAGPYAEKLILLFRQRLLSKRRHQINSVGSLFHLGFCEEKINQALELKNNSYLEALDWLIVNDSSAKLFGCDLGSTSIQSSKNINLKESIEALLEIIKIYAEKDVSPSQDIVKSIVEMGFNESSVREALQITRNNQAAACEWLLGNRTRSLTELRDGLPSDSPILQVLLTSPQVQISLGNPKMFIALLSMLDNYSSMSMWLSDNDTSSVLGHILRTYHEEKHIVAINQFNNAQL